MNIGLLVVVILLEIVVSTDSDIIELGVKIGLLVEVDICEPLNDAVVDPVPLSVLDVLIELLDLALLEITPELVIIEDSETTPV